MKPRFTGLLVASLLCTTAVVPAMAQQAGGQAPAAGAAGSAEACQQLDRIVIENDDRFQEVWLEEARAVAQQQDAQACAPYVQQAEDALAQGESAETLEGRIVVSQPPPSVSVEQPAPQVTVTQPDPNVSVTQQQPEIIVRQVPPTIRIEMPDPVVTIDQPQPEIIVRMPEPQVNVQTSDPQVQVDQAQPRVDVEQGEAEVDVTLDDTPDRDVQEQADIQVQQGTPQVRMDQQQQQGDQAQVTVDQAQPRVTYEPAEPNIEFSGGDQPQVNFTESGEPNVTVEDQAGQAQQQQAGQQQVGQQQAGQQQVGQQQTGQQQVGQQQDARWRGDRQAMTPPTVQVEGYQQAEAGAVSVDNLTGADVFGQNEENIGSVQDVIVSSQGEVEYFVIDVGGFLGIGGHTIALGMDEVTVLQAQGMDDLRVHVSATREQLEQTPEYQR